MAQLNLARKWRPQTFEQIEGQTLAVRMLQNSLYSGHIFPVYLLSGQRGCGKTTTARVFAAAVNCQQLAAFRKDPRAQKLPCLKCQSCQAMLAGNHPDVIEMDAASHTGVDNVRQIIEAASFMPLLGSRKIYLIDEAHMLSKAAFNALLKILEEPPESVLFLLATTDPHKIIDTVTSRCFRLFFSSIDATVLKNHLIAICAKEEIAYDDDGLAIIIAETEGSCRDAINLLEQVRFASDSVNKQAVQGVLGHLDDERLIQLITTVLQGDISQLITVLQTISLPSYSAVFIWRACIGLLRAALWHTCGVPADKYAQEGNQIIRTTGASTKLLTKILRLMFDQEQLFTKTTAQHGMLEMVLIDACNVAATGSGKQKKAVQAHVSATSAESPTLATPLVEQSAATMPTAPGPKTSGWDLFIQALAGGGYDPLIVSLFTQGQYNGYDENAEVVRVTFPQSFQMFQDMVLGAKGVWQPLLEKAFGASVTVQSTFAQVTPTAKPVEPKAATTQQKTAPALRPAPGRPQRSSSSRQTSRAQSSKHEKIVDVSDKEKWKKANALVEAFDGVVTQEGNQGE